VKVPLIRPDNVELPPTPFVQNHGDEESEKATSSSNTPPPPKLIKLTKKSSKANIKLAVNNRALAISQAKTQKAGSVVEIVDKHGNVVGTKIVVGKKNQIKDSDHVGVLRKRGRPKSTGPKLQSVKSLRNNENTCIEKLQKTGEFSKIVKIKSSKSSNQSKPLKVTPRTAVFKLTHRKLVLEALKQAVNSKQVWTKNFPVPMDVVPLELKQNWYKSCEFDDADPMDFNLFEQYIERIHRRARGFAHSAIRPGKILEFWCELASEIGKESGYKVSQEQYKEILEIQKGDSKSPKAHGLVKGSDGILRSGIIELPNAANAGGVNWEKMYNYLIKLSEPGSELPVLNPKEASLVLQMYHKRDTQTMKFYRDTQSTKSEHKPQPASKLPPSTPQPSIKTVTNKLLPGNLAADILQRVYYFNKGYMDYKYDSIFQARPELLKSDNNQNIIRTAGHHISANREEHGAMEIDQKVVEKKVGGEFEYNVHKRVRTDQLNRGVKIEHHWWPCNIFAMNVNVWNKELNGVMPDDIDLD